MVVVWVILLSLLSGLLYRLGGIGKPFNTKYRDFLCPLISMITLWLVGVDAQWWQWVLYFGCAFATMTTYWDGKLKLLFGKGTDGIEWYEWALTGLMYGVSALPIVWGHYWVGYAIRCVALCLLTVLWSQAIDKDWLEEGGRGLLFNATIPLLII